jgi:hypothetical protein
MRDIGSPQKEHSGGGPESILGRTGNSISNSVSSSSSYMGLFDLIVYFLTKTFQNSLALEGEGWGEGENFQNFNNFRHP